MAAILFPLSGRTEFSQGAQPCPPVDWKGISSERGGGVSIEKLGPKEVRSFLDWVYNDAVSRDGTNPGRATKKAGQHLRGVLAWAWDPDVIDALPRFPKLRPQRDVACRHFLSKTEITAVDYWTQKIPRPRRWAAPFAIGCYRLATLVVFFNYGVDMGTSGHLLASTSPSGGGTLRGILSPSDPDMKQQFP